MRCQILFSGKNKKNISKCRLLKTFPRVLSVKGYYVYNSVVFPVFKWYPEWTLIRYGILIKVYFVCQTLIFDIYGLGNLLLFILTNVLNKQ